MTGRRYVEIILSVTGSAPQRWTEPAEESQDFAAYMYANSWRNNLGDYSGSRIVSEPKPGILDRFAQGTIFIEA